jgi:hypothetical protein
MGMMGETELTYITMAGKSIGQCSSGHWLPLRGDFDLCGAGPFDKCKVVPQMDAATESAKRMAAARLADDLERLCCAETETEFFKYVTDRAGSIVALLRVYARSA